MNPVNDRSRSIASNEEVNAVATKLESLSISSVEEESTLDSWISEIKALGHREIKGWKFSCNFDLDKTVNESVLPREMACLRVGNETLGPACSLFHCVLIDYIETLYSSYKRDDTKFQSSFKKSSKNVAMLTTLGYATTMRKAIDDLMNHIRNISNLVNIISFYSGTWITPIEYNNSNKSNVKDILACTMEQISIGINFCLNNKQVLLEEGASECLSLYYTTFEKIEKWLTLLKETASNNFISLYYPLGEPPACEQQFLRTRHRLENLICQINKFKQGEPLLGYTIDKKVIREQKEAIRKAVDSVGEYCKVLHEILGTLINYPDLKNLERLYNHLGHNEYEDYFDKINFELTGTQSVFFSLKKQVYNIAKECLTALLERLLSEGKVNDEELQRCFESLINNCKRLALVFSDSSIKNLRENSKNEVEGEGAQELTRIFESVTSRNFLYLSECEGLNTIIKILQKRMNRAAGFQDPTKKQREYTLGLRDICYVIETLQIQEKEFLKNLGPFRKLPERYPGLSNGDLPHHQLFHRELEQVAEISLQYIRATKEGVESMIRRCFYEANVVWEGGLAIQRQVDLERQVEADKMRDALLLQLAEENKKKVINEPAARKKVSHARQEEAPRVKKEIKTPEIPAESAKLVHPIHAIASIQKCIDVLDRQRGAHLRYLLIQLSETINDTKFRKDVIFGQTDLCRKIIEAVLEIVHSQYLSSEVPVDVGHELHRFVRVLLQNRELLPDNVCNVIWTLRGIPYLLSHANRCVNYLYSTKAQESLSPQADALIRYLVTVDTLSNPALEESLVKKHRELVHKSLYFVQKLIGAVVEPQKEVRVFQEHSNVNLILDGEVIDVPSHSSSSSSLQKHQQVGPVILKTAVGDACKIENERDALSVINLALGWIAARSLSAPNGFVGCIERKYRRNEALENLAVYLRQLRDKFSPSRFSRPLDTVHGQLSLVRRANKELLIGALYHGQYYFDGEHIVQREQLRFVNSPSYLMQTLERVLPYGKKVIQLPSWMHTVHNVLSYPTRQYTLASDIQIKDLLENLSRQSEAIRQVEPGFTYVGPGGTEIDASTIRSETEVLIRQTENEKVFPALQALFQTLQANFWDGTG